MSQELQDFENLGVLNHLGAWEYQFHPTTFKSIESNGFKGFEKLLLESTATAFILYPSKWIQYTNAKGIISKKGDMAEPTPIQILPLTLLGE